MEPHRNGTSSSNFFLVFIVFENINKISLDKECAADVDRYMSARKLENYL